MKYICLAYEEENKLNGLSRDEWDQLRAETLSYVEELRKTGRLITAEPLKSVRTASTVRVRNGKATITDGPFETSFLSSISLDEQRNGQHSPKPHPTECSFFS